ncbi:MAG: type secretion system secreted protein Hcp [Solirubrobacterales bacterium]|jgi:type VI protein secretion system component Hcp|nr:type secretion system secreted protein Hcp [Solirubrobacterales bacterium]
MRLGKLAGAIAFVGVAAAFVPASANAEISLQFIDGGSNPPGGGAVSSFSWGASQPSSGPGGGATGRAKFQEVTLTKPIDSSSPKYPYYLGTGKRLNNAQIFFDQPNSADGLALCMSDVRITKYDLVDEANQGEGSDFLTESLTLNYSKISYVIYLDGGPFNVTFDMKRGDIRLTSSNPCPTNT